MEAPTVSNTVNTRNSVANLRKINLVGFTMHQITGAKLPSNRQVLQVMFYNIRFVDLSAKESAKLTIKATEVFWQQARIPVRKQDKCVEKLLKNYENWKNIQKTIPEKRSKQQKKVVHSFVENLDDLFDIASANALQVMKIEEDRIFLEMQRKKGRPGCMMGIDKALHDREMRTQERREKALAKKRKYDESNTEFPETMEMSDEDGAALPEVDENDVLEIDNLQTKSDNQRGKQKFITPRLLAALDNAKVSDGMAVHILIAASEALGHRVEELVINRSTIHRMRQHYRSTKFIEITGELKEKAKTNGALVVHFDGKFMSDIKGRSKVERIAILISSKGTSKFLGAPKILSSSGANVADAVYQRLVDWDIVDLVKGASYDTTASNTGVKTGAVVLLEKKLQRKLINLPCRHHIYEIMLRAVFETKLMSSSAPEVLMFDRFAKSWKSLNLSLFKCGISEVEVAAKINKVECEVLISFLKEKLEKSYSRDDYKEMVQLALIFLGAGSFNFCAPGPTSNARWMAKAIYCLKIYLFRDQFQLTAEEVVGLRDVCIFIVKIYVISWFSSTNAISAPRQDLTFIKDAISYVDIDAKISEAVLKKISNHLWYITEETVALSFFDSTISIDEKRQMISRLNCKEPVIKLKNSRSHSNLLDFRSSQLSDFVSEKTKNFFNIFGLPVTFLDMDPSQWENTLEFEDCWSFCRDLEVVNDTAERGIKFMQDYNKILTNDEEEKQLVLQIVEDYRKKYHSYKKKDLM